MDGRRYLDDVLVEFRKSKRLSDQALAQVRAEDLFTTPFTGGNSLAIIMKHMAGNMRSRWTDFLTTDGEKPDRFRDREFVIETEDDRQEIFRRWEEGWGRTLDAITDLEPEDLAKSVTIRGEPHTVVEAIQRQLTHYAYHTGQIVLLARTFAADDWEYLSIAPGESTTVDVTKHGKRFDVEPRELP